MPTYNGHPSWNYWNVALWIGNDEGLYRLAQSCIGMRPTRRLAAELMFSQLAARHYDHDHRGSQCTPDYTHCRPTTLDGAPYTVASIQHAMRGL